MHVTAPAARTPSCLSLLARWRTSRTLLHLVCGTARHAQAHLRACLDAAAPFSLFGPVMLVARIPSSAVATNTHPAMLNSLVECYPTSFLGLCQVNNHIELNCVRAGALSEAREMLGGELRDVFDAHPPSTAPRPEGAAPAELETMEIFTTKEKVWWGVFTAWWSWARGGCHVLCKRWHGGGREGYGFSTESPCIWCGVLTTCWLPVCSQGTDIWPYGIEWLNDAYPVPYWARKQIEERAAAAAGGKGGDGKVPVGAT